MSTNSAPSSAPESSAHSTASFEFKLVPLLASIPAALAAAVIGSRLGVQGTLAGAAVTAVVAGLVTQFATFGIERTHHGIRVVIGRPNVPETRDAAEPSAPMGDARVPHRIGVGVAMVGVLVSALATFALTMTLVTAAESTTGHRLDGPSGTTIAGAAPGKPTVNPPPIPVPTVPTEPTQTPTPSTSAASPTPTPTLPDDTVPISATPSPTVIETPKPTASVPTVTTPAPQTHG